MMSRVFAPSFCQSFIDHGSMPRGWWRCGSIAQFPPDETATACKFVQDAAFSFERMHESCEDSTGGRLPLRLTSATVENCRLSFAPLFPTRFDCISGYSPLAFVLSPIEAASPEQRIQMVESYAKPAGGLGNADFLLFHCGISLTYTNNTSYSFMVNRDRYKTVTGFVLLVQASESDAIGEPTFLSELELSTGVRPISLEEIKREARQLKGVDSEHFNALLALRGALESQDNLALKRASERMEKVYRMREVAVSKYEDEGFFEPVGVKSYARILGQKPEYIGKYMQGKLPGPKAANDPARVLSYEVSVGVGSVTIFNPAHRRKSYEEPQIVLWWFEGAPRPAIYCRDARAALYIHTFFLAPAGALSFRICPYDGEQFFQERPNQDYCCVAHREAHRVARFRDNKKRKEAVQERKGKPRGTQKTR
jgi:hypothetical protein